MTDAKSAYDQLNRHVSNAGSQQMTEAANNVMQSVSSAMAGDPPWLKTIYFSFSHPVAALGIGSPDADNGFNISSTSLRFSFNIGLNENWDWKLSQTNAFRHALWQALIRKKYGFDIANEIGYAHEDDENLLTSLDKVSYTYTAEDAREKADSAADQLNNVIGRTIGEANKDLTEKEIAERVLDYYHTTGLWEGTETFDDKGNSTGYTVQRVKLNDEQFKKSKEMLDKLDNDGMNERQRKKYQDKQKKESKKREELHKKALENGIN